MTNVCKGVSTFLRQRVLTRRLGGTEKDENGTFLFLCRVSAPHPWIHSLVVKTPQIWQNCSAADRLKAFCGLCCGFLAFGIWQTHIFSDPFVSLYSRNYFIGRPTLCWEHDQIKRKLSFFYCSICIRFTTRPKEKLSIFSSNKFSYPEFPANCAMIGRYWIAWNNRCYFRSLPRLNE